MRDLHYFSGILTALSMIRPIPLCGKSFLHLSYIREDFDVLK